MKQTAAFITRNWQWLMASLCTAVSLLMFYSFVFGGFVSETRIELVSMRREMATQSDIARLESKLDTHMGTEPRRAMLTKGE